MHLGLYHEPIHTDGRSFDTYGPYARYVMEFARHFDHVTVFAPTTRNPTYFSGCPIEAPNVTVAPLPFFLTHAQALRRSCRIARVFREHADALNVVNARGTAPLAWLLWRRVRLRGVPFVYHFASDPFDVIAHSPKYRGPYRWFARMAYAAEFAIQKRIMRENYSFASGEAIADRLRRVTPNVEAVITSSLTQEDYYARDDSCTGPVVRLLYVGGLRPGKGLDLLVEALGALRAQDRPVVLDLVGDGELLRPLQQQAAQLSIAEAVHFRGRAVMGPELNARYNAADVFVLPSLSEGSPKVVLEAMGHSLPVVSTDVGNVAEMLDGGRRGVLVPRHDAQALAAGVARLLDDTPFRHRCIFDGLAYAREHSVSAFVGRMAEKMRELVAARRRGGAA